MNKQRKIEASIQSSVVISASEHTFCALTKLLFCRFCYAQTIQVFFSLCVSSKQWRIRASPIITYFAKRYYVIKCCEREKNEWNELHTKNYLKMGWNDLERFVKKKKCWGTFFYNHIYSRIKFLLVLHWVWSFHQKAWNYYFAVVTYSLQFTFHMTSD